MIETWEGPAERGPGSPPTICSAMWPERKIVVRNIVVRKVVPKVIVGSNCKNIESGCGK